MKLFLTLISLVIITSCGQSQEKNKLVEKKIVRDFQQDFNSLLSEGEFIADIMDEVTMSPRRQELQEKFMKAMNENPEWFLFQQKIVEKTGKGIPYDPLLGMTEKEWEEYKKLLETMTDMEAKSSGTEKVFINKTEDKISFKTEGKLEYLNSINIDLNANVVNFFEYALPLSDTICVTNPDNVFKTAWRGYKFQYANPENSSMPTSQEELENFSLTLFTFTIGLFENTGKTFIKISGSETRNGEQILRFQIPILINE